LTEPDHTYIGISHIGLVNKINEDRYVIKKFEDSSVLLAVADGLGGEVSGGVAAEMIRETLEGLKCLPGIDAQQELDHLARSMDRSIHDKAEVDDNLEGMGSTLVCVLLRDRNAYWVHIGDSRLYILRKGFLTQVTVDQTLARFLLEEGEITPEQLPSHYSRHVMDQYVGCGYAEPETGCLEYFVGDILMLATDGLYRHLTDDSIHTILNRDTTPEIKSKALLKAALEAGGKDNITVIIAQD